MKAPPVVGDDLPAGNYWGNLKLSIVRTGRCYRIIFSGSWNKVIPLLEPKGLAVLMVQDLLISLNDSHPQTDWSPDDEYSPDGASSMRIDSCG
jgi:hypothetical protein